MKEFRKRGEGASSIVKVPGDMLPARVYFFRSLVWQGIYLPAILVEFGQGKDMLFGKFG